jgi:membrane fusion protein, heavy metal efflux system
VLTSAGASLPAEVRSVTSALDPQTRAATVVLTLRDRAGVAVGEAVQARIRPRASGPALIVVPEEAVQRLDGRDAVFLRTDKGFRVQSVQVGARSGGRATVLAGLTPGQSIATRNAFLLKAELGKGTEDGE